MITPSAARWWQASTKRFRPSRARRSPRGPRTRPRRAVRPSRARRLNALTGNTSPGLFDAQAHPGGRARSMAESERAVRGERADVQARRLIAPAECGRSRRRSCTCRRHGVDPADSVPCTPGGSQVDADPGGASGHHRSGRRSRARTDLGTSNTTAVRVAEPCRENQITGDQPHPILVGAQTPEDHSITSNATGLTVSNSFAQRRWRGR